MKEKTPRPGLRKPLILIIDGHSLVFKAYYAIRGLSTREGIPTNAVYGFLQMLNRILREYEPDMVVVAFDYPAPSFREQLYEQYKAHRPEAPEDFQLQLDWVKKLLKAYGIEYVEQEGYEADDIIGTLCRMARAKGYTSYIASADKDLLQLVDDQTFVIRAEREQLVLFDRHKVKEKMGVDPEKIPDLVGLVGDSTDNIPGVPSIGPKSATKLLAEVDSLEQLLEHPEKAPKEKWQKLLVEHREQAVLSKQLGIIKTDMELPVAELTQLGWSPEKKSPELVELYRRLEFKKLLEEEQDSDREQHTQYQLVNSLDELEHLILHLREAGFFALDTETSSTDPWRCELVGISFSCKKDEAWYLPLGHDSLLSKTKNLPFEPALKKVKPLLEDEQVGKTGHNSKFDIEVLSRYGIRVQGLRFDSMIGSYLLDPDRRQHNLKDLATEHLRLPMTPITELIGKGKKAISIAQVEIERVKEYACRDADASLQLSLLFKKQLEERQQRGLFEQLELPLIAVLCEMERAGIRIDTEYFRHLGQDYAARLSARAEKIWQQAGTHFNLSSPKQVAEVLFERLGLTPVKSGKTGYSTNVAVLEELAGQHPIPGLLLEYRLYEKLKNTYADTLPRLVNPHTGKVHTSFNQSTAATGRLISSDPNLQNIPVRTEQGRAIRKGFLPSEGNLLLAADYSQIELRLLAHLSADQELLKAFREGRDIHRLTAARIMKCSEQEVTAELRGQAKVINFGIIYGMSPHGLAQQLKIPRAQAEQFIEDYFDAYRGVRQWITDTLEQARQNGYVSTLLNRRRYLADINSPNRLLRRNAERIAINAPVQGTAADLIKLAMINIQRQLERQGLQSEMVLQIHDELIFDALPEEKTTLEKMVVQEMERALELEVPIVVDVKWGKNWAEC